MAIKFLINTFIFLLPFSNVFAQPLLNTTPSKAQNTYEFASRLAPKKSSVFYGNQTARLLLIDKLNQYIINDLGDDLLNRKITTKSEVITKLNSYLSPTKDLLNQLTINVVSNPQEKVLGQIANNIDLKTKIAGNDPKGQHKDWNNGHFIGWKPHSTPTSFIEHCFDRLADNALAELDNKIRLDPFGKVIDKIYINRNGVDLAALIKAFLLMSIAYSQATDKYLGMDTPSMGVLSDNVYPAKPDKPYTKLEHQVDEAFGYFGAARDYLKYTDYEIRGFNDSSKGREAWNRGHDTNKDGYIDLQSEFNFGLSIYLAERDIGTAYNHFSTDFTHQAMSNFILTRETINQAVGKNFNPSQRLILIQYIKQAVQAMEKGLAATIIHYINEVYRELSPAPITQIEKFNFDKLAEDYAKLKGLSLGLQFNEYALISDTSFRKLQQFIANKPSIIQHVARYKRSLLKARRILVNTYEFNMSNVVDW